MATRNLTKQFLDLRNAAKANRSLRSREDSMDEYDHDGILLKSQGSDRSHAPTSIAKNTLPPLWVDKVDAIDQVIGTIKVKIDELNDLHRKRLLVNFESDENQQEYDIDIKTREITKSFHEVESLVKQFKVSTDNKNASDADIKARENIQKSVAKRVQALSQTFRQTQQTYMTKLNAQKNGTGNKEFGFLNEPSSNKIGDYDHGMSQSQVSMIDNTEELVNQRDEEINRIAKSIEELAAIFKELAVLVIDQGTILDRIDYNMETAVEHAKEGVVNLKAAEENQKNAMAFRCIIVLVLLIIVMMSILIWKHSK